MKVEITESPKRPTFVPAEPLPEEGQEAQLTDAEIEAARAAAMQAAGFAPKTKEFAEKDAQVRRERAADAAEPPPTAAPKPAAAKPAAAAAKAAPASAAAAPAPAASLEPDLIETAIERGVERGVAAANRRETAPTAPTPKPTLDDTGLTAEERDELAVVRFMEESDETKKGLGERYVKFCRAFASYRAQWQKENPEEEFDPQDASHDGFYAQNDPGVGTEEVAEARIAQRAKAAADAAVEKALKPVREKQQQLDADERLRAMRERTTELRGPAGEALMKRTKALVEAVDKDALALISDDKGNIVVNEQTMAALEAHNPFLREELKQAVNLIGAAIAEIRQWSDPQMQKLGYRFDAKNPVHRFVADVAVVAERDMLQAPKPNQRDKDGRQFVTAAQLGQMRTQAAGHKSKLTDIDRRYWTFSSEDLERLVALDQQEKIAERMQKFERFATARKNPNGATNRLAAAAGSARSDANRRPPSTATDSDALPPTTRATPRSENLRETVLQTAFPS